MSLSSSAPLTFCVEWRSGNGWSRAEGCRPGGGQSLWLNGPVGPWLAAVLGGAVDLPEITGDPIVAVPHQRGLPSDASAEVRDAHLGDEPAMWATFKQLWAYDWARTVTVTRLVDDRFPPFRSQVRGSGTSGRADAFALRATQTGTEPDAPVYGQGMYRFDPVDLRMVTFQALLATWELQPLLAVLILGRQLNPANLDDVRAVWWFPAPDHPRP